MGLADAMLLALVASADLCLLIHLRRRRERRLKRERIMRALRNAVQREVRAKEAARARMTMLLKRAG